MYCLEHFKLLTSGHASGGADRATQRGQLHAHTEVAKGSVFALWLPVTTMDDVAAARAGIWRLSIKIEWTLSATL